jgi:hypothetical protein
MTISTNLSVRPQVTSTSPFAPTKQIINLEITERIVLLC